MDDRSMTRAIQQLLGGLGVHLLTRERGLRVKEDVWETIHTKAIFSHGPFTATAAALHITRAALLELDARGERLTPGQREFLAFELPGPSSSTAGAPGASGGILELLILAAPGMARETVERLHESLPQHEGFGIASPARRTIGLISARLGVEPPEYSVRSLGRAMAEGGELS